MIRRSRHPTAQGSPARKARAKRPAAPCLGKRHDSIKKTAVSPCISRTYNYVFGSGKRPNYQPMKAPRPCTASVTRRPTGRHTLVGTWPNGSPVRMGVLVTVRTCATAALRL